MTQEQKRAELANFLVSKGIIAPDAVEAEIKKMAEQLSHVTAEQKGLTTDIDKAHEVMMIEKGASTPAPGDTKEVAVQPTSALNSAEKLHIQRTLLNEKATRDAVSANTTCEKMIFDRPAPTEQIPAGTTGTIPPEVWAKIEEKYGTAVLPDDPDPDGVKSMSNFTALKAAAQAQTPVNVYIGKLSTKSIGYMIVAGSATGSAAQSQIMTRKQAQDFIAMNTGGYVLAGDDTPGLKLRMIKARNHPTNPGQKIPARTVLAETNKSKAVERGSYVFAKAVDGTDVQPASAKSELCFKVRTNKQNPKTGDFLTRTVRVTVKTTLPKLVMKPEFEEAFPQKGSNAEMLTPPTGKTANAIAEAHMLAIAELIKKSNSPGEDYASVSQYANQLKAFQAPTGQAAPDVQL